MRCKIVDAGFNCDRYEEKTHCYLGVIVDTYEPRVIFKGYKKYKTITVELLESQSKGTCMDSAMEYLKTHTSEDIMKDIVEAIKSELKISDRDIQIRDTLTKINTDIGKLIGKEFEI